MVWLVVGTKDGFNVVCSWELELLKLMCFLDVFFSADPPGETNFQFWD